VYNLYQFLVKSDDKIHTPKSASNMFLLFDSEVIESWLQQLY